MRPVRRLCLCVAVLLAALLDVPGQAVAQTVSDRAITEQREDAVRLARAGQMPKALEALRALLTAGRDDGFVAMDLATLLQQDGKAAEAVAVFEKAARNDPPHYALLAATRAYRDLGRYPDAERLARQGLARFGSETVWGLLLSLVLSDAGRTDEALAVLKQPPASRAAPVERLMAEAYAYRRAGNPARALALYGEAARLAPADRGIAGERAGVLDGLGAPYGAARLDGSPPRPPTTRQQAEQAAAMVRWGAETRPGDPARRFAGTDAALARLDQLLASLPPPPAEAALRRKIRLDRMVALRDRVRMAEAAAEGEALSADAPLPPYAEQAYADALLSLRRPREARAAYERVLAATPKDVAARYGVFYAATELEDYSAAYATIDALVDDEPVWRTYKDDPTRYDNADRQYAEVTAAQARFYGNQLGEAWARITKIADAAPADANARLAQYQIANARGWPQRARLDAGIAASLAPDTVGARSALIERAMADHRYGEAQRLMDALLAEYPEDQSVRRLARELEAKRRWLFEAEAKPGNSDGGGANASGQTLELQGKLTSPPIADNWRVFGLGGYTNAHPPEGFAERARRRRHRLAHPRPRRDRLLHPVVGQPAARGRRRHARLGRDRPAARRRRGRALFLGDAAARPALRHHRRRRRGQGDVALERDAQHRGLRGLHAVQRRQPPPGRRAGRQGTADQPAGLRPDGARRGLCLGQQPAERAVLQSDARPVADRRAAGRARAVEALRRFPGAGPDGRCRALFRAGLPRQLDRHAEVRASLALRSADRAALRRDPDTARL